MQDAQRYSSIKGQTLYRNVGTCGSVTIEMIQWSSTIAGFGIFETKTWALRAMSIFSKSKWKRLSCKFNNGGNLHFRPAHGRYQLVGVGESLKAANPLLKAANSHFPQQTPFPVHPGRLTAGNLRIITPVEIRKIIWTKPPFLSGSIR